MFERLTGYDLDIGYYVPQDFANELANNNNGDCVVQGDAIDRLAAYEDTGLSPEQVQEIAKAKTEGRLVVLPCKPGDTIYGTIGAELRHDSKIEELKFKNANIFLECEGGSAVNLGLFGACYFSTREEAEKAIGEQTERGEIDE